MSFLSKLLGNKQDWSDAPTNTDGLTKFIVANDLHIGSKYQDNPNALEELKKLNHDGYTILNGDLFDFACSEKEDLWWIDLAFINFKSIFQDHYIMGNHERNGVQYAPLVKKTIAGLYVGFAHGDLIANYEKWSTYRKKKPGASWLGLLVTSILDDLDHLKAMRPLPKRFLFEAYRYCIRHGLDALVCSHFHPEAERRYSVYGKTIIILPAHKVNEVYI